MKFFSADWHLGDDRIGLDGKPNLFFRPFESVLEQDSTIINLFCRTFKDGDELWHLGDVVYADNSTGWDMLEHLKYLYPNSKFNLVVGNYDENKLDKLGKYFDNIVNDTVLDLQGNEVYLNHYPTKCKIALEDVDFAITGHIHAHWKTQHNMMNVGVDVTHFKPISEKEILFWWNANRQGFYDENCYPCKPI